MAKIYAKTEAELVDLAVGMGACIATDRITVDGKPVHFMYRAKAEDRRDSGWRFLAGDEDDAYMADNSHHGLYDVNTIANYDRDIIPHLDAPTGSAFGRPEAGMPFELVDDKFEGH